MGCCCKKKCTLYKVKINDTLESPFWSNKYKELGKQYNETIKGFNASNEKQPQIKTVSGAVSFGM